MDTNSILIFKSRIVGGTNAGVNEFTPMAGIVDAPSGSIFCGGAISMINNLLINLNSINF